MNLNASCFVPLVFPKIVSGNVLVTLKWFLLVLISLRMHHHKTSYIIMQPWQACICSECEDLGHEKQTQWDGVKDTV